jgi:hypothetical protein
MALAGALHEEGTLLLRYRRTGDGHRGTDQIG